MIERIKEEGKIFEGKRIYFSAPIKGVPNSNPYFIESIVKYLKDNGAVVLSEHVAGKNDEERNSMFIKESGINRLILENPSPVIRQTDISWVDEAGYLIAIVDTPSIGVGMEIQRALDKHKMGMNLTPVLCLVSEDRWEKELSNMVKGISKTDSPSAEVMKYVSTDHAKRVARGFLLKY